MAGLLHRLGVGRESLRQTLDFATAHGWVVRNPGHGHPLRPEFVLTRAGSPVGEACAAVRRAAAEVGGDEAIGRKWSVPVLRVLAGGPARFGEIKLALEAHGVTDRALSMALRSLRAGRLVSRRVVGDSPPGVSYGLTARAGPLAEAVRGL
jgi:DNA-binding HxlR family transcriptional regulator